ncbi:hypothetical protein ES703_122185 [subsurface metagenome]
MTKIFCPIIKKSCRDDCQFFIKGNCLVYQFMMAQVKSFMLAEGMMKPMIPILRQIYGLPEEVKDQFPDNLKQQIEDILKKGGIDDESKN